MDAGGLILQTLATVKTGKKTFGETFGAATGVSAPGYRRSGYEATMQAAKPPL